MNEAHEALDGMGRKILAAVRTDLYLSMHFLGPSLESLSPVMDLSTHTVGTDGTYIRYNTSFLMQVYLERPRRLNRTYMHMLMHCLFRHMYAADQYEDQELWGLCCDIAVESVIDTMDYPAIDDIVTDRRMAVYEDLKSRVKVLTAQRLYRDFTSRERDYREEARLEQEFGRDDHSFWERLNDRQSGQDGNMNPSLQQPSGLKGSDHGNEDQNRPDASRDEKPQQAGALSLTLRKMKEDEWKKNAQKLHAELTLGNLAGTEKGSLERTLSYSLEKRADFTAFLQKFLVTREEAGVDPDSFDYGFYYYGMELYGNMPLIEENEFREARKVEQLVIAIDTSASCERTLVQKFLNDTASLLLRGDSFFHRTDISIIECDDQVQNVLRIRSTEQMKEYADRFVIKGGYGTDFRPVLRYIDEHPSDYRGLKGLMYFTDGYGIYPARPAPYDTAFVFEKDEDYEDKDVPKWAVKLYI